MLSPHPPQEPVNPSDLQIETMVDYQLVKAAHTQDPWKQQAQSTRNQVQVL